jgi:hypothetical protein
MGLLTHGLQNWVSEVLESDWNLARSAPEPSKQTHITNLNISKQAYMHCQPTYKVWAQTTNRRYGVPPDTPQIP